MPFGSHPRIAREGLPILMALGAGALLLQYLFGLPAAAPLLLLLAAAVYLLRDPYPVVPADPLALVCPAQGKIVSVKRCDDPWLRREAWRIRIRMSPLNIFSFRSPTEGKVQEQWQRPPSQENGGGRDYAAWVRTDEQDDVVLAVHVPRRLTNFRFWSHLITGGRTGQGHRIGYLLLGGDFEVFTPVNVSIEVEPGQSVRSGNTILAHLVHNQQVSAIQQPP